MSIPASRGFLVSLAVICVAALAFVVPTFSPPRTRSSDISCKNNLKMIDVAKQQWTRNTGAATGSIVDSQAVYQLIGDQPRVECPRRGHYSLGEIGVSPRCSCGQTLDY